MVFPLYTGSCVAETFCRPVISMVLPLTGRDASHLASFLRDVRVDVTVLLRRGGGARGSGEGRERGQSGGRPKR